MKSSTSELGLKVSNMCNGTSELCIHIGVAQVSLESLQGHKVSTSNRVIINFYSIYNLKENHAQATLYDEKE